jgi:hypothetical protein
MKSKFAKIIENKRKSQSEVARGRGFVAGENSLYDVTDAGGTTRTLLGSELKDGVPVIAGARLTVRPSLTHRPWTQLARRGEGR